jgi:hypothetical protein
MKAKTNPFTHPPLPVPEADHDVLVHDASTVPRAPLLIAAADVRMENATFAWEPYVPLGSTTVVAGLGGLGKSHLTISVVARATRGQLEGDLRGTPVGVVIATAEDALAQTMVPRLVAAGADLDRVSFVNVSTGFTIPDDLGRLEEAMIARGDVRMVVLDPLIAFIPTRLDSHKDQHARAALAPLAGLAERHGAAIICVMHLNKSAEAGALFLRVSSSVGFLNAARSAVLVADDPDDEKARVMAHGKSNLSEPGSSLRFRIEAAEVGRSDDEPVKTSRIVWLGNSKHSTEDLLRSDHRRDPRDAAEDWLIEQLAQGPTLAGDIRKAADANGHSWRTVERAKTELGVESFQPAIPGPWYWALPGVPREVAAWGPEEPVSAGQRQTATFPPIGGGLEAHFMDRSCPECGAWPHQGGHFAGCSMREGADA